MSLSLYHLINCQLESFLHLSALFWHLVTKTFRSNLGRSSSDLIYGKHTPPYLHLAPDSFISFLNLSIIFTE